MGFVVSQSVVILLHPFHVRPPSGPPLLRNWYRLSLSIFQFMPQIVEEYVVCQKQIRGKVYVQTYCSALQCQGQFMNVAKEQNCFATFHSIELQHQ